MTLNVNEADKKALEQAKSFLYRIAAELSLAIGESPEDQARIDSARRMAADNALKIEDHLRGF